MEKSNVDISKELTDLLVTQRAFELNSRSLKTSEEMWQIANNLRSK
ncbi:flagellar basal body rod C-terminal domain-containing protein [Caloramator sp. mosi_1]